MDTSNKKTQNNLVKRSNKKVNSFKKKELKPNNTSSGKKAQGGRTTISPPSKIKQTQNSGIQILASNIDTIKLSINIVWKDQFFFEKLKEGKNLASDNKGEYPVSFYINKDYPNDYLFNIKEHGAQGYEWILLNQEYSLLIGNWEKPKSRPSVLVGIKSETLWRKGPYEAIYFILDFLRAHNGELREPKISRLDLCLDALFPDHLWKMNLLKNKVTRASSTKTFHTHNQLSGIAIGKSDISVRMYDKPLEIQQQSKKNWMYDVWGLETVPEGFKIIRTEFQLRREAIKQLGIHTLDILFERILNIWAYCTKDWLKFQNNPEKQSHQRETLSWWKDIQNGFNGMESGHPSIRFRASNADMNALSQQILGLLSSYAAIEMQTTDHYPYNSLSLSSALESFYDNTIDNQLLSDIEFKDRVENKKAKYQRMNKKMISSLSLRKQLGFK